MHTRQTTSDTTSVEHGTRNADKSLTSGNLLTILDVGNVTAHREVVCTDDLAILILHVNRRNYIVVFRLNDDALGHTRRLVGLSLVGLTLSDVMETKCTGVLGNDDSVERVPTADDIVFLHHVTILEEQR